MHISVILEREMPSFGKNVSLIRIFDSWVLWSFKYEVEYMAWHSH